MTDLQLLEFIKRVNATPESFWRINPLTAFYSDGFLEYRDSGVGEEYVLEKIKVCGYPDATIESILGGCDTCGYGRTITVLLGRHETTE